MPLRLRRRDVCKVSSDMSADTFLHRRKCEKFTFVNAKNASSGPTLTIWRSHFDYLGSPFILFCPVIRIVLQPHSCLLETQNNTFCPEKDSVFRHFCLLFAVREFVSLWYTMRYVKCWKIAVFLRKMRAVAAERRNPASGTDKIVSYTDTFMSRLILSYPSGGRDAMSAYYLDDNRDNGNNRCARSSRCHCCLCCRKNNRMWRVDSFCWQGKRVGNRYRNNPPQNPP